MWKFWKKPKILVVDNPIEPVEEKEGTPRKTPQKQSGNLRPPWKKGESGNHKGRPPKGYSITGMMKEMLESNPDVKAKIGKKVAEKAMAGDITAVKLVWQYMDGMPLQGIELSGPDGSPMEHNITWTINFVDKK